jgi:hypothetical protein
MGRAQRAVVVALAAAAALPPAAACHVYAYGGVQSAEYVGRIGATLTALERPDVASGHVGAWIGIGGVGEGPDGLDEWLQVGLSGLEDGSTAVYLEIKRGKYYRFRRLVRHVVVGKPFRFVLTERRPGRWRVEMNRRVVARVHLDAIAWRADLMAESWKKRPAACNTFRYRIGAVSSPDAGRWTRLVRWAPPDRPRLHRVGGRSYVVAGTCPASSATTGG